MGPNTAAVNYSFEWDLPVQKIKYVYSPREGTIAGELEKNKDVSIFNKMLVDSKLGALYNECLSNFTVFVPMNDSIITKGCLDERQTVLSYTLEGRLPLSIFQVNRGGYYNTKNRQERLFIESFQGKVIIDRKFSIISSVQLSNGIIHYMSCS